MYGIFKNIGIATHEHVLFTLLKNSKANGKQFTKISQIANHQQTLHATNGTFFSISRIVAWSVGICCGAGAGAASGGGAAVLLYFYSTSYSSILFQKRS